MLPIMKLLSRAPLLLALLLTGCSAGEQCPEFAAPASRQNASASCTTLWSRTSDSVNTLIDGKPSGKPAATIPTSYCYRSLAATECFTEPQPGRPNFSGTYP